MKAFILEAWRKDYISAELSQNGFRNDPSRLFDIVVDEVAYAIFAPVHEQQQATYGVFIAKATTDWASHLQEEFNGELNECSELTRYCADGIYSYILRSGTEFKTIRCGKDRSFRTQARLFILRDNIMNSEGVAPWNTSPPCGERDLIVVRRDERGTVTIIHWDGVTRCHNGRWSFTPHQYRLFLEEHISSSVSNFDTKKKNVLRSILGMCLNILSPGGIGATIIMHLDNDTNLFTHLSDMNSIKEVPAFEVRTLSYQFSIAHVLSQCDGAAIISDTGVFRQVGLWLTPSAEHLLAVQSAGGTRQLTAHALSKVIDSPIITVSSDGPVRAYYKGAIMFDTSSCDSYLIEN